MSHLHNAGAELITNHLSLIIYHYNNFPAGDVTNTHRHVSAAHNFAHATRVFEPATRVFEPATRVFAHTVHRRSFEMQERNPQNHKNHINHRLDAGKGRA
jgi:hypothetical protein